MIARRVLVTGGSGFIGRAVVARLGADGFDVSAPRRQVVSLDAASDWRPVLTGVDAVVHAAARAHQLHDEAPDPLSEYRRVNVAGTVTLAQQAAAAGVRRFVFLSSIKVHGEATAPGRPFRAADAPSPADPYGVSKMEAEQALRSIAAESGMELSIVRPVLVYGPGVGANFLAMMRWLHRGVPLPLGAVRNLRSLAALGNVVDLIARCVHHPAAAGRAFLVSDGDDLSTPDLLRRLSSALGRPARLLPVPAPLLRAAAGLAGQGAAAARLLGSLQVDITDTRAALDWTPPVAVDAALAETATAFLQARG